MSVHDKTDNEFDRFDEICDLFEREWSTNRTSIETCLETAEESLRPRLLRELIHVEYELVIKSGRQPSQKDYQRRFPQYTDIVDSIFQQMYRGRGVDSQLGNYELLEKIGEGGMGAVYKARHVLLNKTMAVKLLPQNFLSNDQAVARFRREMEVVGKLNHVNIVQAMDAGEVDGTPYLAMEYVEGIDLARLSRQQEGVSIPDAINYVLQAARGLEHAHERGIIHRDVKPANLILDKNGIVRVLDMGLARFQQPQLVRQVAELTHSGLVVGTIDYMSPEQAFDSTQADHRSDIYSLGCTLFRLITGKVIYDLGSLTQRLLAHRDAPIPSLTSLRQDVPAALDLLFRQMVAKSPGDRPQRMADVIRRLESLQGKLSGVREGDGLVDDMTPVEVPARPVYGAGRAIRFLTVCGIIAVCLVAIITFTQDLGSPAPEVVPRIGPVAIHRKPESATLKTVSEPLAIPAVLNRKVEFYSITEQCSGNVDVEADFDEQWIQASELGVRLHNDTDSSYYDFRIRAAEPTATMLGEVLTPTSSFAALKRLAGHVEMMIVRNGVAIQSMRIPLKELAAGHLHLRVQRVNDSLVFQLNSLKSLDITDPFPLDGMTVTGHVFCNNDTKPAVIQSRPHPMEYRPPFFHDADALLEVDRFDEALIKYKSKASDVSGSDLEFECIYKQGVCLQKQGRRKDAYNLWTTAFGQSQTRWSQLAGVQLWLVHCVENRGLGDPVMAYFSNDENVRRLCTICPLELREAIRNSFIDRDQFAKFVLFKADRRTRLRRLAEIDRLLDVDGLPTFTGLLAQIHEWEYLHDISNPSDHDHLKLRQALAAAELLYEQFPSSRQAVFRLEKLLRLTGGQGSAAEARAIQLIENQVDQELDFPAVARLCALVHLAQVYAGTRSPEVAIKALERIENVLAQIPPNIDANQFLSGQIHLMKGYLLEESGRKADALSAWKVGALDMRARLARHDDDPTGMIALVYFSLLGLSRELDQSDVNQFFHPSRFLNTGTQLDGLLSREIIRPKNLAAWIKSGAQNLRGHQLIRGLAYDQLVARDYLKWPALLAAEDLCHEVFSGQYADEQAEVAWQLTNRLIEDIAFRGFNVFELGYSVAANLARGDIDQGFLLEKAPYPWHVRYLLAQRQLSTHAVKDDSLEPSQLTEIESLLKQVVVGTKNNPELAFLSELASLDIELLQERSGLLQFYRDDSGPAAATITKEGQVVETINVPGEPITVRLSPGIYQIKWSHRQGIPGAEVRVRIGGRLNIIAPPL